MEALSPVNMIPLSSVEWAQWVSALGRGPLYIGGGLCALFWATLWMRRGGLQASVSTSQRSTSQRSDSPHRDPLHTERGSFVEMKRALVSARSPLHFAWRVWTFLWVGALLNLALKLMFAAPRPWWSDPNLIPLSDHPSRAFGLPSGHTQSACISILALPLLIWIYRHLTAGRSQETSRGAPLHISATLHPAIPLIFMTLTLCWPLITAWSRVTLNAHSLSQVICGGAVGLMWIGGVLWIESSPRGARLLLLLIFIVSLCLIWRQFNPAEIDDLWRLTVSKARGSAGLMEELTARGSEHSPHREVHIGSLEVKPTLLLYIGALSSAWARRALSRLF